MADPTYLTINTDGGSRGNPGAASFAYVIQRDGECDIEDAGRLGNMTNNQAEYTAVVRALEHALEIDRTARVTLNSDSELLVKQMKGEYRVKNEELRPLYERACALARQFSHPVTFNHVRREQNKRADELGNEVLDGKRPSSTRGMTALPKPATLFSKPEPPRPNSALKDEAVTFLRQALDGAAEDAGPTAEAAWREIVKLLERHGVKVPG